MAVPLERVAVPMVVPPSWNVTVPVGVPVPGGTTLTVAFNVTVWPEVEGFGVVVSTVVVATAFTVCVTAVELLAAKLVLPP